MSSKEAWWTAVQLTLLCDAAAWYATACYVQRGRVAGRSGDIARLLLSAFLGITLGDTAWLQALQLLGATRT